MNAPRHFTARFVTPRRLARRVAGRLTSTTTLRSTIAALGAAGVLAASTVMVEARFAPPTATVAAAPATVAAASAPATTATTATEQAPADAAAAEEPPTGPGYRLVAADGGVFNHGWYDHAGSATGLTPSPIIGFAQTNDGDGYWLAAADGGVFAFGDAPFFGSAVNQAATNAVDIAARPGDDGYWVATRDGGVFTFGSAGFHGAAAGSPLNAPVVSVAPTPSGNGYWLASADGGVFAFGDAPYHGAAAGTRLNSPITSIVPTVTGNGYWLVARDGGVFAFGDAPFLGALVGQRLNKPIVDMEVESRGRGYWLVSSDGGVFAFGEAPFLGSVAAARLNAPVIAIEGGVGRAVPAPAPPPPPPPPPPAPAVSAASAARRAAAGGAPIDGKTGWDISYPQCGGPFPAAPFGFGIVGVNGGRMFKHNRCLAEEWKWALSSGAAGIYLNINFPRSELELSMGAASVRQPACNGAISCIAYNFGWNGVGDAMRYARSQGVDAPFAWLDVEQLNYWTQHPELNAVVLRGAIDAVRAEGLEVGIYSTPYQYGKIMGAEAPGVPVWTAGAPGFDGAARYCTERAFAGGPVAFAQLIPGQFDPNLACPGAGPASRYFRVR